MKYSILSSLALLAAMALTTTTTQADEPVRTSGAPVTMFIRGPGGSMITGDTPLATPVYASRSGLPAVAPDGHHLTVGEWFQASGRASVKCTSDGTHVTMHLSGLIPKGVYTVWVVIFDGPFGEASETKPAPFGNLVGAGVLGAPDGSENGFQASASGEAQLSAMMPTGLLSWSGPGFLNHYYDLQGCLLDEYEFHLLALYHFDGQEYGPVPGFEHGGAEQIGFMFQP